MSSDLTEEWRPVVGYEGLYEVSSIGRVRSLDRVIQIIWRGKATTRQYRGVTLAPSTDVQGYQIVGLSRNGRSHSFKIQHLVAPAFIGPRPDGMFLCHNNDVKADNRVENLRWDTPSSNVRDMVRLGNHHLAKQTECKRGHPFDEWNTVFDSRGRFCRTCRNDYARLRMRRTRAAQKAAVRAGG